MKSLWKQVRYRLEYFGCRLLAGLIPRLPRWACLWLAERLGALFFRFDRRSRVVALENLRVALGDTLDATARCDIARRSFLNFARAMLDLFWARNLTPENWTRHIKLVDFHHVFDAHAEHGSVIFLSLHAGSHEWVALTGGCIGLPASMVALDFKNNFLDAVFRTAREHSGNRIIGQQQSMLKLLRTVRRRGNAGLLVDLALRLDHPGQVIDAFGMKMYTTFLHALLHSRAGVPMVPVTNVPNPDGTCSVTAHAPLVFAPGTDIAEITQRCWDCFEPFIRARPELWLWNYKHWRYQPRHAGREYPFYSQSNEPFERVLRGEPVHGSPTPKVEQRQTERSSSAGKRR